MGSSLGVATVAGGATGLSAGAFALHIVWLWEDGEVTSGLNRSKKVDHDKIDANVKKDPVGTAVEAVWHWKNSDPGAEEQHGLRILLEKCRPYLVQILECAEAGAIDTDGNRPGPETVANLTNLIADVNGVLEQGAVRPA